MINMKENRGLAHHTTRATALGSVSKLSIICALAGTSVNVYAEEEDKGGLEEIVVTAQRRAENLQSVPITISHVSGERIAQQAVESFKDIGQLVSGISIRENNDQRNVGFLIRGIGSNQSFIGIEPSAAINVDGEVMSRNSALFGDINDVESIAILKGPQGTLFGKNTVAGAMQIKTKRPNLDENSGNIKATIAESGDSAVGEYNVSGMYNMVLDDKSALRMNFFQKDNNGWVENVFPDGPNGGESDAFGGRLQLLHRFNEDTEILFRADYSERDFGPGIRVFLKRDDFTIGDNFGQIPQSVIDSLNLTPDALEKLLTTNLHEISQTPFGPENNMTSAANNRDYGGIDSFGGSMEINHSLASGHDLTFTMHYRETDLFTNDSLIGTVVDAFPLNFSGPVLSDTIQSEFRIASPVGGAIDYVAGAFYLHSKVTREQIALACQDPGFENSTVDANFEVVTCGGFPFGLDEVNGAVAGVSGLRDLVFNRELRNNDLITDNGALFGQLNYHPTNKLTFVAGARVLVEHQDFSLDIRDDGVPNVDIRPTILRVFDADGNQITFPDGSRWNVPNPFLGQISENPATDTDQRDPSTPFATQQKSNTDVAFIYKLAAQYQHNDDLMVYASYSTGYKGVGWFTDSDVGQADLDARYPIPPETSRNIEVGFRSEWLDGDLRFNASYFNTRFDHYQDRLRVLDFDIFPIVNGGLQNILNDPNASGQPVRKFDIVDAGTLETEGVDVEFVWKAMDHLTLAVNWSHVEAKFANTNVIINCGQAVNNGEAVDSCTDVINFGEFWDWTFPRRGQFFELDGAALANAPEDTITADITYDYSVSDWNGYVRWNYRYKSDEFTNHGGSANNDDSTTMPAVGIHNLFIGISSPDDRYSFTLFVKNLFNKHYFARKTNFGDGLAERLVGAYPSVVPELVGIAQAYPTYGAVPDGRFFRQRPEHGNVPRDFDRYIGATFELKF